MSDSPGHGRQGPPSGWGQGEDTAALGFLPASAAAETAGRQPDNSVLKSPSQLAGGSGKLSKERSALPGGCSSSSGATQHGFYYPGLPTAFLRRGQSGCWSPGAPLRKYPHQGKVACSFPGKSKSHLAKPLRGWREPAQTLPHRHVLLVQLAWTDAALTTQDKHAWGVGCKGR